MISNGIVIGLRPAEIRDMIPKDVWLCFDGWQRAHEPKKPGSDAMTQAEYHELLRQVDGGHSRAA